MTAAARVLPGPDEDGWLATVRELAVRLRWYTYHPYDSRRSEKGFPDLTLIRPPRVVFAELKTERGRIKPEQKAVKALLDECPGVETYLWRPPDLDRIVRILR